MNAVNPGEKKTVDQVMSNRKTKTKNIHYPDCVINFFFVISRKSFLFHENKFISNFPQIY